MLQHSELQETNRRISRQIRFEWLAGSKWPFLTTVFLLKTFVMKSPSSAAEVREGGEQTTRVRDVCVHSHSVEYCMVRVVYPLHENSRSPQICGHLEANDLCSGGPWHQSDGILEYL